MCFLRCIFFALWPSNNHILLQHMAVQPSGFALFSCGFPATASKRKRQDLPTFQVSFSRFNRNTNRKSNGEFKRKRVQNLKKTGPFLMFKRKIHFAFLVEINLQIEDNHFQWQMISFKSRCIASNSYPACRQIGPTQPQEGYPVYCVAALSSMLQG